MFVISIWIWSLVSCEVYHCTKIAAATPELELKPVFKSYSTTTTEVFKIDTSEFRRRLLESYNCYNAISLSEKYRNICDSIRKMYEEDSKERINEYAGTYHVNNPYESYLGYSYQAHKSTTTRTTRKKIKPRRIRSTTDYLMGNVAHYEVYTDPINETKTSTEQSSVTPPVTKTTSLSSDKLYITTRRENVTRTTNPVTTTLTTKPSTTETTTTEKYRKPSPILLTIIPDSTEIIATEGEIPNLRCEVSGSNLPKLLPYVVSWYEREDGGNDVELNFEYNATTLAFNKTVTGHDLNHEIYCSIKFNIMAPTVFAKMSTPYVPITRIKKPETNLGTNDTDNLQEWIIGGAVGGITLLLIIIVLVVLLIRYRKQRAATNNRPPEPPIQNSSSGVYETPEDPIYSYVPISVVTFYEAKAMAAANKKIEMQSIKPPPLPQRPPNMSRSDDYDYAYAVNNRRPPPPT